MPWIVKLPCCKHSIGLQDTCRHVYKDQLIKVRTHTADGQIQAC